MLGRPFAIDDSVIDVDLPSETSEPVFNHLARLGHITSTMHVSIYHQDTAAQNAPNNTDIMALRNFHTQLTLWRLEAPTFDSFTCFYETHEFFELTYQESRLWLFRAAINKLPVGSSNMRDKLLSLCLQAAQRIIACFNTLWRNNLATYSRAFTRLILVSGLITVSVIKMQICTQTTQPKEPSGSDVDIDCWLGDLGLDSSTSAPTLSACRETIDTAGKILVWLAAQMPDVSAYAQIFDTLKREVEMLGPDMGTNQARYLYPNQLAQSNGPFGGSTFGPDDQQTIDDPTVDDLLMDSGDLLGNDTFWSFTEAPWMEEIDDNISGFIWDTIMPWQGSPLES